mmetsp:Transcript_44486/g.135602  ORF Transcript_44486/g.135602 Transcript_44486/m.135602 type:complete len:218 (-) Transcript_44486:305-958(-)
MKDALYRSLKRPSRKKKDGKLFYYRANTLGGCAIQPKKNRRCLTYCQDKRSSTLLVEKERHVPCPAESRGCCLDRTDGVKILTTATHLSSSPKENSPILARRVTIDTEPSPRRLVHTKLPSPHHESETLLTLLSPVRSKWAGSGDIPWALSEKAPVSALRRLQNEVDFKSPSYVESPRFIPVKVKSGRHRKHGGGRDAKRTIRLSLERAATIDTNIS